MSHRVIEGSCFAPFIATAVPEHELIISRTDLHGIITYANATFAEISGYGVEELIGQPHSIVRHPDMPASLFADLWKSLKSSGAWSGNVKNLRKDGGYYWVHAQISGVYKEDQLIEYKSLRTPISLQDALSTQNRYDALRLEEEHTCRFYSTLKAETYKELAARAKAAQCSMSALLDLLLERH
jgi:aerotaxis receptor